MKRILFVALILLLSSCGFKKKQESESEAKETEVAVESKEQAVGGVYKFNWGKKKYPMDIPFRVVNAGSKSWVVNSVQYTGTSDGGNSYDFTVKCTATGSVSAASHCGIVPYDREGSSVGNQKGVYLLPGASEGEQFTFTFTALYKGFQDQVNFGGFEIG